MLKNPVPASKKTPHISTTKTNWFLALSPWRILTFGIKEVLQIWSVAANILNNGQRVVLQVGDWAGG
jgi:hypothetical protein